MSTLSIPAAVHHVLRRLSDAVGAVDPAMSPLVVDTAFDHSGLRPALESLVTTAQPPVLFAFLHQAPEGHSLHQRSNSAAIGGNVSSGDDAEIHAGHRLSTPTSPLSPALGTTRGRRSPSMFSMRNPEQVEEDRVAQMAAARRASAMPGVGGTGGPSDFADPTNPASGASRVPGFSVPQPPTAGSPRTARSRSFLTGGAPSTSAAPMTARALSPGRARGASTTGLSPRRQSARPGSPMHRSKSPSRSRSPSRASIFTSASDVGFGTGAKRRESSAAALPSTPQTAAPVDPIREAASLLQFSTSPPKSLDGVRFTFYVLRSTTAAFEVGCSKPNGDGSASPNGAGRGSGEYDHSGSVLPTKDLLRPPELHSVPTSTSTLTTGAVPNPSALSATGWKSPSTSAIGGVSGSSSTTAVPLLSLREGDLVHEVQVGCIKGSPLEHFMSLVENHVRPKMDGEEFDLGHATDDDKKQYLRVLETKIGHIEQLLHGRPFEPPVSLADAERVCKFTRRELQDDAVIADITAIVTQWVVRLEAARVLPSPDHPGPMPQLHTITSRPSDTLGGTHAGAFGGGGGNQLSTSPSLQFDSAEIEGPLHEAVLWREAELRGEEMLAAATHLNAEGAVRIVARQSDISLAIRYDKAVTRIRQERSDAKDTARFLQSLDNIFRPLYHGSLQDVVEAIPAIVHNLFLLHNLVGMFRQTSNLERILIRTTAQLVRCAKAAIWERGNLWAHVSMPDINQLTTTLQLALTAAAACREEYQARDFPSSQMDLLKIFGKLDLFCKRLQKLLDLFTTMGTFAVLKEHSLEGIDALVAGFFKAFDEFRMRCGDPLDHTKPAFDKDFAGFKKKVADMDCTLQVYVNTSFENIPSTLNALLLLRKFSAILRQDSLQADLRAKYVQLFHRFGSDIETVQRTYEHSKHQPPTARHAPPVAGKVLWTRHLLTRIEGLMSMFQESAPVVVQQSRKVVGLYNRIATALVEYEAFWLAAWRNALPAVQTALESTVVVHRDGHYAVNFDPAIATFWAEVRWLLRLKADVSPDAKEFYKRRSVQTFVSRLQLAFQQLEKSSVTIHPDIRPALCEQRAKLDLVIAPGTSTLTWGTVSLEPYVTAVETTIKNYSVFIERVNGLLENRIHRTLLAVGRAVLLHVPDRDEMIAAEEYEQLQQRLIAAKAEELSVRSEEIREAVLDLCGLVSVTDPTPEVVRHVKPDRSKTHQQYRTPAPEVEIDAPNVDSASVSMRRLSSGTGTATTVSDQNAKGDGDATTPKNGAGDQHDGDGSDAAYSDDFSDGETLTKNANVDPDATTDEHAAAGDGGDDSHVRLRTDSTLSHDETTGRFLSDGTTDLTALATPPAAEGPDSARRRTRGPELTPAQQRARRPSSVQFTTPHAQTGASSDGSPTGSQSTSLPPGAIGPEGGFNAHPSVQRATMQRQRELAKLYVYYHRSLFKALLSATSRSMQILKRRLGVTTIQGYVISAGGLFEVGVQLLPQPAAVSPATSFTGGDASPSDFALGLSSAMSPAPFDASGGVSGGGGGGRKGRASVFVTAAQDQIQAEAEAVAAGVAAPFRDCEGERRLNNNPATAAVSGGPTRDGESPTRSVTPQPSSERKSRISRGLATAYAADKATRGRSRSRSRSPGSLFAQPGGGARRRRKKSIAHAEDLPQPPQDPTQTERDSTIDLGVDRASIATSTFAPGGSSTSGPGNQSTVEVYEHTFAGFVDSSPNIDDMHALINRCVAGIISCTKNVAPWPAPVTARPVSITNVHAQSGHVPSIGGDEFSMLSPGPGQQQHTPPPASPSPLVPLTALKHGGPDASAGEVAPLIVSAMPTPGLSPVMSPPPRVHSALRMNARGSATAAVSGAQGPLSPAESPTVGESEPVSAAESAPLSSPMPPQRNVSMAASTFAVAPLKGAGNNAGSSSFAVSGIGASSGFESGVRWIFDAASTSASPKMLPSFYKDMARNSEIVKAALLVTGSVFAVQKKIRDFLEVFTRFRILFQHSRDAVMTQFAEQEISLEIYDNECAVLDDLNSELTVVPDQCSVGAVQVSTLKAKAAIESELAAWHKGYLETLRTYAHREVDRSLAAADWYLSRIQPGHVLLNDPLALPQEMAVLSSARRDVLQAFLDARRLSELLGPIGQDMLHRGGSLSDKIDRSKIAWAEVGEHAEERQALHATMSFLYRRQLKQMVSFFLVEIKCFKNDFDTNGPSAPEVSPPDAIGRLTHYKRTLDDKVSRWKLLRSAEELFSVKEPCYAPELAIVSREVSNLQALYAAYMAVESRVSTAKKTLWKQLDIKTLASDVATLRDRMRKLPHDVRQMPAYLEAKLAVDRLHEALPVLELLALPSIKERHWRETMRLCDAQWDTDPDVLILDHLLSAGLVQSKAEIADVAVASEKETELEQRLRTIAKEWKAKELIFAEFKHRGFVMLHGEETASLREQLDEALVILGSTIASRYCAPFRAEAHAWSARLSAVAETLSLWTDVQSLWVYLEAVFGSGDIVKQLPNDAKRFMMVDKLWGKMMHKANEVMTVVDFCDGNDFLKSLPYLMDQLEICQRALASYLEQKRASFARFYFMSDTVLLEVLSQASDPFAVQTHLRSIFDGISELDFEQPTRHKQQQNTAPNIVALRSASGEVLPLVEPVSCSGHLEVWLHTLCQTMADTVRMQLLSGVEDRDALHGSADDIGRYFFAYPAQVVATVFQIAFTTDVTNALSSSKSGVHSERRELTKHIAALRDVLVQLAGQSKMAERHKIHLQNLTALAIYHQDTWDGSLRKLKDSHDFDWFRQLRFYWTEHRRAEIRIADAEILYRDEFLDVRERLVITPLTDRCYLALSQAIAMRLGGSATGPAGTGKTETVKDLGRAAGKYVVVLNCSEQLDTRGMAKIFKGLAMSGAWGCFDEFNRIALPVLSVAAQQIHSVLLALKQHKSHFPFPDGATISLHAGVGIFVTMNPGYAGRHELPENLKALFRGVAMMVPDRKAIIRVKVAAAGYRQDATLARKVDMLFSLCEQQLSRQKHYDFGLRSILSALRSADDALRAERVQLQQQQFQQQQMAAQGFNVNAAASLLGSSAPALPPALMSSVLAGGNSSGISAPNPSGPGGDGSGAPGRGAPLPAITVEAEEALFVRTLKSMNIARLLYEDVPVFTALLQDLFPTSTSSQDQTGAATHTVEQMLIHVADTQLGLIPTDSFITKCLQLYETKQVRHGIMLVGPAGSGKTSVCTALLKALSEIDRKHRELRLNPRAVTAQQLFGRMDPATGDWFDGVLSFTWRKANRDKNNTVWIVCDGPVDTLWVESLNTVLDDNKMLTLPNGDRLMMTPTVRMCFEVESLENASPATVSRAGMVFVSHRNVGWQPVAESFISKLLAEKLWSVDFAQEFSQAMNKHFDVLLAALSHGGECKSFTAIDLSPQHIATSLLTIARPLGSAVCRALPSFVTAATPALMVFTFACAWAFGGPLPEHDRARVATFVTPMAPLLPPGCGIFDVSLDIPSPGDVTGERKSSSEEKRRGDTDRESIASVGSDSSAAGAAAQNRTDRGSRVAIQSPDEDVFTPGRKSNSKPASRSGSIFGGPFTAGVKEWGLQWKPWAALVPSNIELDLSASQPSLVDVFLPTTETTIAAFHLRQAYNEKTFMLVSGGSGTGKTAVIESVLKASCGGSSDGPSPSSFASGARASKMVVSSSGGGGTRGSAASGAGAGGASGVSKLLSSAAEDQNSVWRKTNISSATTPQMLQGAVEGVCEKRMGATYGPKFDKKLALLVDDLHMAEPNEWGDRETCELFRQLVEWGGMYALERVGEWRKITDIQFFAAAAKVTSIPARLRRHALIFHLGLPSGDTLFKMSDTIIQARFSHLSDLISGHILSSLSTALLAVWKKAQSKLLPTPSRFHYSFTLRDVLAVLQGMCLCDLRTLTCPPDIIDLWRHEANRAMRDKLNDVRDVRWFDTEIEKAAIDAFGAHNVRFAGQAASASSSAKRSSAVTQNISDVGNDTSAGAKKVTTAAEREKERELALQLPEQIFCAFGAINFDKGDGSSDDEDNGASGVGGGPAGQSQLTRAMSWRSQSRSRSTGGSGSQQNGSAFVFGSSASTFPGKPGSSSGVGDGRQQDGGSGGGRGGPGGQQASYGYTATALFQVRSQLEAALRQYTATRKSTSPPLQLVLFDSAVYHVARICRVLSLPRGSALLVGTSGSGKQSLARLAAHVQKQRVFQLSYSSQYTQQNWLDDLRTQCLVAGTQAEVVFLMSDAEVKSESFLEQINAALTSGEVPGLFAADERDAAVATVRTTLKQQRRRGFVDSEEWLWQYFLAQVRARLHFVLCFSPQGETLRKRARRFPALFAACTVIYHFTWPSSALAAVANAELEPLQDKVKALNAVPQETPRRLSVDTPPVSSTPDLGGENQHPPLLGVDMESDSSDDDHESPSNHRSPAGRLSPQLAANSMKDLHSKETSGRQKSQSPSKTQSASTSAVAASPMPGSIMKKREKKDDNTTATAATAATASSTSKDQQAATTPGAKASPRRTAASPTPTMRPKDRQRTTPSGPGPKTLMRHPSSAGEKHDKKAHGKTLEDSASTSRSPDRTGRQTKGKNTTPRNDDARMIPHLEGSSTSGKKSMSDPTTSGAGARGSAGAENRGSMVLPPAVSPAGDGRSVGRRRQSKTQFVLPPQLSAQLNAAFDPTFETTVRKLPAVCAEIHAHAVQLCDAYYYHQRQRMYATPKLYLQFLHEFSAVYMEKAKTHRAAIRSYTEGLEQLRNAETDVTKMRLSLDKQEARLADARVRTASLLAESGVATKQAEDRKEEIAEVTQRLAEDAEVIGAARAEAEKDLARAKPALQAAIEALEQITPNDMKTLKALQKPPEMVRRIFDGVCLLLHHQLDEVRVEHTAKGRMVIGDSWARGGRQLVTRMDFLEVIMNFNSKQKDRINDETCELLEPYLNQPDFHYERARAACGNVAGLCTWTRAMVTYREMTQYVAPKIDALAIAEKQYNSAIGKLQMKRQELAKAESIVRGCQMKLDEAKKARDALEEEATSMRRRMTYASDLIVALADEKERWQVALAEMKKTATELTGNAVVAAAYATYCGPFNADFREKLEALIHRAVDNASVSRTKNLKFSEFMVDEQTIAGWRLEGLPADEQSTTNAIIIFRGSKVPLVIDPQGQAMRWLRAALGTSASNPSPEEVAKAQEAVMAQTSRVGAGGAPGGAGPMLGQHEPNGAPAEVEPIVLPPALLSMAASKHTEVTRAVTQQMATGNTMIVTDVEHTVDRFLGEICQKLGGGKLRPLGLESTTATKDEEKEKTSEKEPPSTKSIPPGSTEKTPTASQSGSDKKSAAGHLQVPGAAGKKQAGSATPARGGSGSVSPAVGASSADLVATAADSALEEAARQKKRFSTAAARRRLSTIPEGQKSPHELAAAAAEAGLHVPTHRSSTSGHRTSGARLSMTGGAHRGSAAAPGGVGGQGRGAGLAPGLSALAELFPQSQESVTLLGEPYDFDPRFALFFATASTAPMLSPEVFSQTAVLDFAVTEGGLEQQLLASILKVERHDLEVQKEMLMRELHDGESRVKECEAELLAKLSNTTGSLVDDESLIMTLSNAKAVATQIKEKIASAQETTKSIDAAREDFRPVAKRGSILYFVSAELSLINEAYGMSLERFALLFDQAVQNSKASQIVQQRIQAIVESLMLSFFGFVGRGLYEHHKTIFSLMLAIRIDQSAGNVAPSAFRLFLRGGSHLDTDELSRTRTNVHAWLSTNAWKALLAAAEEVPSAFQGLTDRISHKIPEYKAFAEADAPETLPLPEHYNTSLSPFERMLFVRLFREDRTLNAGSLFVREILGSAFEDVPAYELGKVADMNKGRTPVLFLLSAGSDPTAQLETLAKRRRRVLYQAALGEGQEQHCMKTLLLAAKLGEWAVFQNCHLGLPFLRKLDSWVADGPVDALSMNPSPDPDVADNFRIFLTAEPAEGFPSTLLRHCVKLTNEPPMGMQPAVKKAYSLVTPEMMDQFRRPEWRACLCATLYFHAAVLERRKYGPRGWSKPYDFSDGDLQAALTFLQNYFITIGDDVRRGEPVSWDAMRVMIGDVQYGGRVSGARDRVTLRAAVDASYNAKLLDGPGVMLAMSKKQFPLPDPTGKSFLQFRESFIDLFNAREPPQSVGLTANAECAFQTHRSTAVLLTLQEIQPRQATISSGRTPEEIAGDAAKSAIERLPAVFDQSSIKQALMRQTPSRPIDVFFALEAQRHSKVLEIVRAGLKELLDAIEGAVVITPQIDAAVRALANGRVPPFFVSVSWAATTMNAWLTTLAQRHEQLRRFLAIGTLSTYWLAGFFSPRAFMQSIRQELCRRKASENWVLDRVELKYEVMRADSRDGERDKTDHEGVYLRGLYLEGASFDRQRMKLRTPPVREIVHRLPLIYVSAVHGSQRSAHANAGSGGGANDTAKSLFGSAAGGSTGGVAGGSSAAASDPITPQRPSGDAPSYNTPHGRQSVVDISTAGPSFVGPASLLSTSPPSTRQLGDTGSVAGSTHHLTPQPPQVSSPSYIPRRAGRDHASQHRQAVRVPLYIDGSRQDSVFVADIDIPQEDPDPNVWVLRGVAALCTAEE